jgi:serine/threonine protein kinase
VQSAVPAGDPPLTDKQVEFEPSADDPLRRVTPSLDDVEARRAREAVAGRLFSQPARPVTVGRYRITERIGSGGMGMVYRAHDPELARDVAVKVMNADAFGEDEARLARARLVREARAMARLAHPNVIHVYDVGTVEQGVFIAMELVEGHALDEWLERNRGRGWQTVLARLVDAGRGLAAAHAAGVIHRDFKPENVLVGDDGRVRVCDFGLAGGPLSSPGEPLHASHSGRAAFDATLVGDSLTRTGALLGTPKYMPPEAESGAPASARSDQFSFCVALYEALYGYPPFRGDDVGEYRKNVRLGRVLPPPPDSRVKAWVHSEIVRGLAVDPAQRHPGMDALLERLEAALPDPRRHARRRRRLWISAALVLVGLVGGASWSIGRQVIDPDDPGMSETPQAPAVAPGVAPTRGDDAGPSPGVPPDEPAHELEFVTDAAPRATPHENSSPDAAESENDSESVPNDDPETPTQNPVRPRVLSHCYFAQDKYTFIARSRRHKGMLRKGGRCYDCSQSVAHRRDSLVADDGKGSCDRFYECFEETPDRCVG